MPRLTRLVMSVATLVAAGLAASAHAENFSGPYVGLEAGLLREQPAASALPGAEKQKFFGYGADVDYDFNLAGSLVAGAEVNFALAAGEKNLTLGSGNYTFKPQRTMAVSARVGILASPTTLIYGRAGYENGRSNLTTLSQLVGQNIHNKTDAFMYGAGIEQMLVNNLSVRVEARKSSLSERVALGLALRF